jgi:TRAP-type C4-dicarboxylate transport system permease small subunit
MGEPPLIFRLLSPGPVFLAALGIVYLLLVLHRLTLGRRVDPEKNERRIQMAEAAVLSLILFAMIFFAVLQIVLRNFFSTGLIWIDPLLRYLVLWVGLLGAYAATRRLRHITIDVLGRVLPGVVQPGVRAVTSAVAVFACALLTNASWAYLRNEVIFGSRVFLGIPSWIMVSILVFGFAGIGWRFLEWVLWPRSGGPGRPPLTEEELLPGGEDSPAADMQPADGPPQVEGSPRADESPRTEGSPRTDGSSQVEGSPQTEGETP